MAFCADAADGMAGTHGCVGATHRAAKEMTHGWSIRQRTIISLVALQLYAALRNQRDDT